MNAGDVILCFMRFFDLSDDFIKVQRRGIDDPRSIGGGIDPCSTGVGKVSYLGGHAYDTKVPISEAPKNPKYDLNVNLIKYEMIVNKMLNAILK